MVEPAACPGRASRRDRVGRGWTADEWEEDGLHPAYYTKQEGDGEVLYLNLGHCRGHYDMQPMVEYYPEVERGSWNAEEYYELLRRGIRYCAAA